MFARSPSFSHQILRQRSIRRTAVTRASRWDLRRRNVVARVSKWGQPLKAIGLDYIEVTKDLLVDAKQHPLKTLVYLLTGSMLVSTWRKCPNYASYLKEVMEYSSEMGMCNETLLNPQAKKHIDNVIMLNAEGCLRCVNLGFFSVIVQRNHSPSCANYTETCEYLQPRLWKVLERVVDVGVWGKWLQLDKRMLDFDVNEDELTNDSS